MYRIAGRSIFSLVWLATTMMVMAQTVRAAAPPLAWTYTYTGGGGDGWLNTVAVDTCGNVFGGGPINAGANLLVVKLDLSGSIVGSDTVGGATNGEVLHIAVDHSGSVLVAGYVVIAGEGRNAFLRKYTNDLTLIWSRTHNSAGSNDDWYSNVDVDSANNPVVIGVEIRNDLGQSDNWLVRKYDVNGNIQWSRSYNNPINSYDNPRGVAVDTNDNVIVGGFERQDIGNEEGNWRIHKYDPNGTLLWSRTHNNPVTGSDDEVDAVDVDAAGNVYVAGHIFTGPWPNYDWMVRKYDANGTVQWTKTYATASGEDWPRAAVLLADGTFAVGGLHSPSGNRDWLVIDYDASGNVMWTLTFTGQDGLNDAIIGMAADACGNLYCAGEEHTASAGDKWRLHKYGVGAYAGCGCAGTVTPPPPPTVDTGSVKIVGGIRGYLNPRNGEQASILVKTSGAGTIHVHIYDRLGHLVREFSVEASGGKSTTVIHWDATDAAGKVVPPGIYPIYVDAPGVAFHDKLAVLH